MSTQDLHEPKEIHTPDDAQLSDEQLGNINAAGGGVSFSASFVSSLLSLTTRPRVNPVNPALHPDDPADGTAIQGMRNRGGGGSI